MPIIDRVILLLTGLVAIYLLWRLLSHKKQSTESARYDLYYMVSFLVLLVAGLLLIIFTYDALESEFVVIVGVLIPAGLALGLVAEFAPSWEKAMVPFALAGLVAIAITRFVGPANIATIILACVHAVFGLTIVLLPIVVAAKGKAPGSFVLVSVGGIVISLGGMALAFLKSGRQLLFFTADLTMTLLAPILLVMALAYTWGLVKKMAPGKAA
ncbi:MAG: hypothetical protein KOO61_09850 [Spirochaetales bacterium]|nr:hypothetical protein [Spirochaetales bacterium]